MGEGPVAYIARFVLHLDDLYRVGVLRQRCGQHRLRERIELFDVKLGWYLEIQHNGHLRRFGKLVFQIRPQK